MITVCCVWVHGHVPYSPIYVVRLMFMVRRWLKMPHRFVCLTDRPDRLRKDVETIQIPGPGDLRGWWSKLRIFDPSLGLDGRMLYLDLDSLIVGDLQPIVEFPAPLALVPHAGTFSPRASLQIVRRFNSSVVVWDAGAAWDLWTDWRPAVSNRLWGDQDWIGEHRPDAATMPIAWFPRLSECLTADEFTGPPADGARVILCKKPKNIEAARRWPAIETIWRAA